MCLERRRMGFAAEGRKDRLRCVAAAFSRRLARGWCDAKAKIACSRGQGTTEYAILVGVLVVIAILAISVFRPKLQELWDAIANGINAL